MIEPDRNLQIEADLHLAPIIYFLGMSLIRSVVMSYLCRYVICFNKPNWAKSPDAAGCTGGLKLYFDVAFYNYYQGPCLALTIVANVALYSFNVFRILYFELRVAFRKSQGRREQFRARSENYASSL